MIGVSPHAEDVAEALLLAFGEPATYRQVGAPAKTVMGILRKATVGMEIGGLEVSSQGWVFRFLVKDIEEPVAIKHDATKADTIEAQDGTRFVVKSFEQQNAMWVVYLFKG